jgi:hypothetical protein
VLATLGCALLLLQDPARVEERPPARPVGYRAGPFYLAPRLRIGTIGVDTNVFYTATERRSDFTAAGGPGLAIVLPVKSSVRLSLEGGADYIYFLRTRSQRRLAGDGKARVDFIGTRALAGVEGGYRRTFGRPSFEVDRRIVQDQLHARVDGLVDVGARLELRGEVTAMRLDVPAGQDFGGADLRRSLSRDSYLGRLTSAYRLTPKTSFLLEVDHQVDRFTLERLRDTDSNRLGGGFEIRSTALLSGKAVAGVRSFRLRHQVAGTPLKDTIEPYVNVDLTYHFGPRTRLGAAYGRDVYFSAYTPASGKPTVRMEVFRVRLEKGLVGALDVRLFSGLTRLRSDSPITVTARPGEPVTAVRDDEAWEGGADLGYTFRRHLRIGVAGSYTERRSTFGDFGMEGLLVGGTITFTP